MISLVVKHCTYFWTLILGDSLIAFALWLMSGISREDQGQATRTLVMYELISKWDFIVSVESIRNFVKKLHISKVFLEVGHASN